MTATAGCSPAPGSFRCAPISATALPGLEAAAPTLSIAFTNEAEASKVLPPADQQEVADALGDDAEVMSNTQLEKLLADEPVPLPEPTPSSAEGLAVG